MAQVSYGTITITDTTDIDSIKNWYLATSASSGVTKETDGWTPTIQQMTTDKQYLWNYEQILGTGGVEINSTQPVIIGRYGKDGAEGNSITSIDEYYQITNSTSNPGSSGWSKNTLVVPTSIKKYLWNYQVIHYSKTADEGSYTDARIIGVYGDKGERGTSILKVTTQPTTTSGTAGGFSYSYRMSLSTVINESGKTEVLKGDIIEYNSNHYQVGYVNSSYVYLGPVTSIKGADSTQYYVFIRYSANSNGSGYVETPTSNTKYIGVYMGTSSSPPAYNDSGWTWSKYVGDPGTPATQYYAFVKYATDANGSNMQDSPDSTHIYVGTYTGTNASPAASAYKWSKYVGDNGQPATQYYAFIKYATSSSGANMTDTPTTSTKYVGTYSGTKSSPTASDYKWSEYVGADGVSVTAVKEIYYLTTGNAPTAPSAGTNTTSTSTSTNIWTTVVPTYVPNGKYYTSIQTTLSKGTSPISSTAILNNALTDESYRAWEALSISQAASEDAQGALSQAAAAQYQAEALDAKLKAFFWPGDSNYTGAYAVSGIDGTTLNPSSISTYGFNVAIRPAAVSIGYNAIKALELDGSTPSLKFYVPSKTTQATNPSMELKSSALTFYKIGTANKTLEVSSSGINLYGSSTSTADATLTSSGLKLVKGGIIAGSAGQSGYIYLSTENHPVGSNGVTINNFTPTSNTEQWREVIGTKFGVTNAGTLYASNVNISGNITASSLTIDSSASVEGLSTANITGMDAYSTTSEIETYVSNQGYQTASDVSNAISTGIGNASVSDLSDGSDYSTTSDMNGAISAATNDMATKTYVSNTYATQTALTTEINQRKAQYGTCETTYNTRDKVVTCDSFELVAGNEIMVYFHNSNNNAYNTYTTYSIRLNVNNKGLKDVWVAGAVTSSTNQLLWADGAYITFKYDGSKFIVIGEPRSWYGASTIGEGVASKTDTTAITGCVICKGTKIELAMSKRNTSSSPTLNIRSTGAKSIYYGNTKIGPTVTNGHSWLDSSTATFTFDGQYYRMAGQTVISGDSITTGTINANRIDVAGIISAGSIVTDTLTGGTINTSNYIRVSTQDLTSGIPVGTSETKTDWRIIAGTKFGVDKEGYTWASELILGNGITGTTLAQTSALVDQYEKVLTVTEQTDNNLIYENLSIHQYQGSENTVDENSQSISYIQTQLNFNSNRMTFTQNIIDNTSPDANATIEVAHIDATNDGIFYIEKLKPTSIIFRELELIEYNKGLGIRRRS